MPRSGRLRVLQQYPAIRATTNPYVAMLHQALVDSPEVEPLFFSHRRALLGRYDVVHLHWPEARIGGRSLAGRIAHLLLATAWSTRLRWGRTPVVRTVHNLDAPSGLWRAERRWLRGIDRLTVLRIVLSDGTPTVGERVVIPHGHYRDWFAPCPRSEHVPGRIAFAGLVRQYKNVPGLIEAFHAAHAEDSSLSLHVAGNPSTARLAATVRAAVAGSDAIRLELRFLDDAALVTAITQAELIALPYHHMHNSGATLLALSLDRPVLVPDTALNRALAEEVGPGWVHTFAGELGGDRLREAVTAARLPRGARPDLSARGWTGVGASHAAAYRKARRLTAHRISRRPS